MNHNQSQHICVYGFKSASTVEVQEQAGRVAQEHYKTLTEDATD
jgi:hypothetical protein